MGMLMSYMKRKGERSAEKIYSEGLALKKHSEGLANQTLTLVLGTLYDDFRERDIKDFDEFYVAILDLFSTVNMSLPGKHYNPPLLEDVRRFYGTWKEDPVEEKDRSEKLIKFMKDKVNTNKVDTTLVVTGIVAPPAAMVAKKTGPIVPQLRFLNSIPYSIFVPPLAISAIVVTKFIKIKFMKSGARQKLTLPMDNKQSYA